MAHCAKSADADAAAVADHHTAGGDADHRADAAGNVAAVAYGQLHSGQHPPCSYPLPPLSLPLYQILIARRLHQQECASHCPTTTRHVTQQRVHAMIRLRI
jgi:hypothetical protein